MIGSILAKKLFGSHNDRLLKRMQKVVQEINGQEEELQKLSDEALKARTTEFKARLEKGETLDQILPEAFAVVREASRRVFGMRHYDVQLIGGMVLHQGKIAEMATGEGKTLMATAPLYLRALTGKGAHLVTVNDYLAKRDAEQMGKLYGFLGLTTGVIVNGLNSLERRAAYACDITYGTNNEFGFDYLRDNMAFSREEQVQRGLHFAVVDEVDSILIDEARTPLIISGAAESSSDMYIQLTKLIPKLKKREQEDGPGDYYLDEKTKQAYLTEAGHDVVEKMLVEAGILSENESLYSPVNVGIMHYFTAVLRANTLFNRDVDYIVKENEVVIIDEHTGRAMVGRRWSDGLHQAIEAKEGVSIQNENQTLASITFQNYFKLYKTLAGMTGTADTEAYELHQTYNLDVVVIPTNKPMIRINYTDMIYLTAKEKFTAIVEEIKECQAKQQPVLVGTASIETSEYLAGLLNKAGIKHEILNAKQHAREAAIIAQAGRPGAVTIATNMAGRGTDIILGGNWQAEIAALQNPDADAIAAIKAEWQNRHDTVVAAGGLHIIGSERHESRRIDNQLRGRAGRQGDPGASRFYLSLEDNLIRIFASQNVLNMMRRLGMGKGEALESHMLSRAVANAQKKVESHNFDIRKQLLQYDNVVNDQRQAIYSQRNELLGAENVSEIITAVRKDVIAQVVSNFIPKHSLEEQWDVPGLEKALETDFAVKLPLQEWLNSDESLGEEGLQQRIIAEIEAAYEHKKAVAELQLLAHYEKMVLLQTLDNHWREHLANMDHLRHSINLRGYAQKDPKQEYKREAYELFSNMLDAFRYAVISMISKVEVRAPEQVNAMENQWRHAVKKMEFQHAELDGMGNPERQAQAALPQDAAQTTVAPLRNGQKVGRNDPCPCGSGKKFKQCHGQLG